MSAAKTAAERIAQFRARKAKSGLSEVRGIWAPPELHAAIRELARRIQQQKRDVALESPRA